MNEMLQESPLTKEEIEKWIYRCAIDEDASPSSPSMRQFEMSYFEMCFVTSKLQCRLSESDFTTFAELAYKKCIHLHSSSSEQHPWSDQEQAQLQRLQDKAIHRSKKRMDKIHQKQEKKRGMNQVAGQTVRLKSTGRIGVGVGSLDPKASKDILVRFDDDGETVEFVQDREDLEIICPVCNKGAGRRCSKCKQAWYCGRDCQVTHWKEHKKSCKQIAAAAASSNNTQGDDDESRELDLVKAYIARERSSR